jgi:O-succinylbenzoic acid--CoA ligase
VPPPLTVLTDDGSPAAVRSVLVALASAIDGGPPITVHPPRDPSPTSEAASARAADPAPATTPGTDGGPPFDASRPLSETTALVVTTSGSSGNAKQVELSADALRASAAATHARLGGPGAWLLALPVQHIAGLQVLVRSLLAGVGPTVLDRRTGFTPEAFAHVTASMPADDRRYTALVPTQLVRLMDDGTGLDALRTFDAVLVGGAACPPALLDRAHSAGIAVVTTYGMTETAGGCVYDGHPLDGVRIRLTQHHPTPRERDTSLDPAAENQTTVAFTRQGGGGRIELSGPMLALGYRGDPEGTAAAFAGGWFRTDDLGTIGEDGALDVIGRLDDMIVTGGRKVAPALVERALTATPGVAQACVVGVPDPEWGQLVAAAVQPTDPANPPAPSTLRTAARDLAGPAAAPKLIRFVDALPHRGPGKIDRAAVRALLTQP